jgi:hypothetical protein
MGTTIGIVGVRQAVPFQAYAVGVLCCDAVGDGGDWTAPGVRDLTPRPAEV